MPVAPHHRHITHTVVRVMEKFTRLCFLAFHISSLFFWAPSEQS